MSSESEKCAETVTLYRCEPLYWKWMPSVFRFIVGWVTIMLFCLSFLGVPICCLLLFPFMWRTFPTFCYLLSALAFMSMIWPRVEWPFIRRLGQLWFEIFQLSTNIPPEKCLEIVELGYKEQLILAMSPHGIVPFQAVLWAAYSDQYFSDPATGRNLYGFGAAADVTMYLPFLRNINAWLTAGPADYKSLKDGLQKGINVPANAALRYPAHLYILPGGVAEVFLSAPGKHDVIFKERRGLVKLSLETGAHIVPLYVFGGTDFFENLATSDGVFARWSRKFRAGVTVFWGRYGLPFLPFTPRVTFAIGDPLPVEKWVGEGPVPPEKIEALHVLYMKALEDLFEKHKAAAGYPDAKLTFH